MLTLFHAPRSRSSRIVWLLEELGAEYAIRYVSIRYGDGSGDGPDAANLHPDKKVPALDHDGTIVSESTAIALYLCELHPEAELAPAPGDADRAAFLTWMCWADTEFGPALLARFLGAGNGPRAEAGLNAVMRRLNEALARGPYLMGERFTAADVMIAAGIGWGRAHLPASDAVDAYLGRVLARPAFVRAQTKDAAIKDAPIKNRSTKDAPAATSAA